MFTMFELLTALTLAVSAVPVAPAPPPAPQVLVWNDEFDGASLDLSKWTMEVNADGGGNHELQYYTDRPENVRLEKGELVLTSRQEHFTGADGQMRRYTSGRIKTEGKFAQKHGRFEARMKLPRGQGMWPAFWMLGADRQKAGWPACGEIDIMENIGKEPALIHGSIHGPGYSGAEGLNAPYAANLDGWHVYAIDWFPNRIDFYMDGVLYATRTPASLPKGGIWAFEHPFFLLLNNAVGGSWPGTPNASTKFPQELRVDYVRVWALTP